MLIGVLKVLCIVGVMLLTCTIDCIEISSKLDFDDDNSKAISYGPSSYTKRYAQDSGIAAYGYTIQRIDSNGGRSPYGQQQDVNGSTLKVQHQPSSGTNIVIHLKTDVELEDAHSRRPVNVEIPEDVPVVYGLKGVSQSSLIPPPRTTTTSYSYQTPAPYFRRNYNTPSNSGQRYHYSSSTTPNTVVYSMNRNIYPASYKNYYVSKMGASSSNGGTTQGTYSSSSTPFYRDPSLPYNPERYVEYYPYTNSRRTEHHVPANWPYGVYSSTTTSTMNNSYDMRYNYGNHGRQVIIDDKLEKPFA